MKPWLAPLLVLALAPTPSQPSPATPPSERWAWNARERTAAGARALVAGDADAATAAFDVAQRLRPDDPRTLYNAGTARIGHDDPGAVTRLDAAARGATAALAPDAWYNLGTAKLAAGDARGAVEALTEALRRAPDRADAKTNLELALAAQNQPPQSSPSPSSDDSEKEDADDSPSKPGDPGSPNPSPEPSKDGQDRDSDGQGESSENPREGAPPQDATGGGSSSPRERPLPQFHDLPDMTAEQAAAILRAVEDLEREQRRERAERAAAERAQVEIDW